MDITTPPASLRALWKKVIFNCSPSIRAYDSDPSDSPGSFTCDGLTQIVPRFFPTLNPYRRSPPGEPGDGERVDGDAGGQQRRCLPVLRRLRPQEAWVRRGELVPVDREDLLAAWRMSRGLSGMHRATVERAVKRLTIL